MTEEHEGKSHQELTLDASASGMMQQYEMSIEDVEGEHTSKGGELPGMGSNILVAPSPWFKNDIASKDHDKFDSCIKSVELDKSSEAKLEERRNILRGGEGFESDSDLEGAVLQAAARAGEGVEGNAHTFSCLQPYKLERPNGDYEKLGQGP